MDRDRVYICSRCNKCKDCRNRIGIWNAIGRRNVFYGLDCTDEQFEQLKAKFVAEMLGKIEK
jgi:hypothetical protein